MAGAVVTSGGCVTACIRACWWQSRRSVHAGGEVTAVVIDDTGGGGCRVAACTCAGDGVITIRPCASWPESRHHRHPCVPVAAPIVVVVNHPAGCPDRCHCHLSLQQHWLPRNIVTIASRGGGCIAACGHTGVGVVASRGGGGGGGHVTVCWGWVVVVTPVTVMVVSQHALQRACMVVVVTLQCVCVVVVVVVALCACMLCWGRRCHRRCHQRQRWWWLLLRCSHQCRWWWWWSHCNHAGTGVVDASHGGGGCITACMCWPQGRRHRHTGGGCVAACMLTSSSLSSSCWCGGRITMCVSACWCWSYGHHHTAACMRWCWGRHHCRHCCHLSG